MKTFYMSDLRDGTFEAQLAQTKKDEQERLEWIAREKARKLRHVPFIYKLIVISLGAYSGYLVGVDQAPKLLEYLKTDGTIVGLDDFTSLFHFFFSVSD